MYAGVPMMAPLWVRLTCTLRDFICFVRLHPFDFIPK